jgi:hypothetical protein
MLKAKAFTSQEVKTFKSFDIQIRKPNEFYVLGLFHDDKTPLYNIYTDLNYTKFPEDFKFFHTFETAEFLKYIKSKKITVPTILVFYHDLVITKNEPKFRVFETVCLFQI